MKDPQLLPLILARTSPLLTIDRRIIDDNIQYIPDIHPGIVIVKTLNTKQPITTSIALAIIEKFKAAYPIWHKTDWSGKCLEMDEVSCRISVVRTSLCTSIAYLSMHDPSFLKTFSEKLDEAHKVIGAFVSVSGNLMSQIHLDHDGPPNR